MTDNQPPSDLGGYGIKTRRPRSFPSVRIPLFREDFSDVVEQGTSILFLAGVTFFSTRQKSVDPYTVLDYIEAKTVRKSAVWGEEAEDGYEHLEYPQVVRRGNIVQILDGHHRIASAIHRGTESIEAYIIEA